MMTKSGLLIGWFILLPITSSVITHTIVISRSEPYYLDTTQSAVLSLVLLKCQFSLNSTIMKPAVLLGWCILLPIASSFITYAIVIAKNKPIALDPTQGAILSLALLKFILLGGLGVFPINLDRMFTQVLGVEEYRPRRSTRNTTSMAVSWRYKEIPVHKLPCLRRLFCEIETAAKTSDTYGDKPSENDVDRHPEEEVDVESPDPQLELYTEAVRALYGYDSPSAPDSSPATEKALVLMQALTGKSCEQAYKICSGRYTAPMVFGKIFNELKIRLRDEL